LPWTLSSCKKPVAALEIFLGTSLIAAGGDCSFKIRFVWQTVVGYLVFGAFDEGPGQVHSRWVLRWEHPANRARRPSPTVRCGPWTNAAGAQLRMLLNWEYPVIAMVNVGDLLSSRCVLIERASRLRLDEVESLAIRHSYSRRDLGFPHNRLIINYSEGSYAPISHCRTGKFDRQSEAQSLGRSAA
jgi:hypothetical protein